MAFIAPDSEDFEGEVVGNGQCVLFVKKACRRAASLIVKRREKVAGAALGKRTAIANFK